MAEKGYNDYYELAKNQEYSKLLDTEVQLENAKANSIKYTNNSLANRGLDSQGYGSSAQTGIYNDYMNAVGTAKQQYNSNVDSYNQQQYAEQESAQADNINSIAGMASQAPDVETLNKLYADSGYGSIGEDGSFTLNDKAPEGMSDSDWNILKYYYNAQNSSLSQNAVDDDINYTTYTPSNIGTATFNGTNGVKTLGSTMKNTLPTLQTNANNGTYKNGDVIIMDDNGEKAYLQYTSNGFRIIDESTYDSAGTDSQYYVLFERTGSNHVEQGKGKKTAQRSK